MVYVQMALKRMLGLRGSLTLSKNDQAKTAAKLRLTGRN